MTAISAVGIGEVGVAADVLGGHDAVRAAIGLARDHGQLGHGGFAERVEQLGPVLDDATELLGGPGQKAGHVLERDERDVEAVAEADEPGRLERCVDVQASREVRGLVGDDSDRAPAEPAEADDDVGSVGRLDLEEVPVVERRTRSRPSCRRPCSADPERSSGGRRPGDPTGQRSGGRAGPPGCSGAGTSAARGWAPGTPPRCPPRSGRRPSGAVRGGAAELLGRHRPRA